MTTGEFINIYPTALKFPFTMQAQKEAPSDMQCKDKFLVQSVIAPSVTTNKDITPEIFNQEDGKVIDEFKLRFVYVPANPPSPVPDGSEEGGSPRASLTEDESKSSSLPEAVSRSLEEPKAKSSPSEAWSLILRLTEEKASALQQNQKLCQELELVRKDLSKSNAGNFSILFVVLIGLIGLLVGYLIKKT